MRDGAQKSSSDEETMDTTEVEKFFAVWKDNSQEQMETQMVNATNAIIFENKISGLQRVGGLVNTKHQ